MPEWPRLSHAARTATESDTRLGILLRLQDSAWTASELAVELGVARATISHHLKALSDADLIEVVSSVPIAGGPLRSYGAKHTGLIEAVDKLNAAFELGS